jgi:hypothetical protein
MRILPWRYTRLSLPPLFPYQFTASGPPKLAPSNEGTHRQRRFRLCQLQQTIPPISATPLCSCLAGNSCRQSTPICGSGDVQQTCGFFSCRPLVKYLDLSRRWILSRHLVHVSESSCRRQHHGGTKRPLVPHFKRIDQRSILLQGVTATPMDLACDITLLHRP